MRIPTDAQGRLLAIVEELQPVFCGDSGALWTEGPCPLPGLLPDHMHVQFPKGRVPRATVRVALAQEWLSRDAQFVAELTEDGVIALGVWRQRKRLEPPLPTPQLDGQAREIVALAERAMCLGFRIAPRTDEAKRAARCLTRDGWVGRGFIGAGTRAIVPTALGRVEVNPAAADDAFVPDPLDF